MSIFAEDEGTVVKNETRLYSTNLAGLTQVSKLLKNKFKIKHKIYSGYGEARNVYGIVIYKKEDLIKFKRFIGFKSKEKIEKLNKLIERKK